MRCSFQRSAQCSHRRCEIVSLFRGIAFGHLVLALYISSKYRCCLSDESRFTYFSGKLFARSIYLDKAAPSCGHLSRLHSLARTPQKDPAQLAARSLIDSQVFTTPDQSRSRMHLPLQVNCLSSPDISTPWHAYGAKVSETGCDSHSVARIRPIGRQTFSGPTSRPIRSRPGNRCAATTIPLRGSRMLVEHVFPMCPLS
jgi:hypothetical protein